MWRGVDPHCKPCSNMTSGRACTSAFAAADASTTSHIYAVDEKARHPTQRAGHGRLAKAARRSRPSICAHVAGIPCRQPRSTQPHHMARLVRKVLKTPPRDGRMSDAVWGVRGLFGPGFLAEPSTLLQERALSYLLGCRTFDSHCTPTRSGAIPADVPVNITWMGDATFLDAAHYLRRCA